MNFRDWIATQKVTDTPAGDFIGDVQRDTHFPHDIETWDRLRSHLVRLNACPEAIIAAGVVWQRFRRASRK
jgi:YozE SAM-like fold